MLHFNCAADSLTEANEDGGQPAAELRPGAHSIAHLGMLPPHTAHVSREEHDACMLVITWPRDYSIGAEPGVQGTCARIYTRHRKSPEP